MMNQQMNMETDSQPESTGGIDGIIATVQEYKDNPQLVTPETLDQLLSDLMDLKNYLDEGEQASGEPQKGEPGGLSIIIGKHGGKQ